MSMRTSASALASERGGERQRVGETIRRPRRSSAPLARVSAPVANSRSTPCARANAPISRVARLRKVAELRHVTEHQPLAPVELRQHLDAGAHRARIGVVGVVDEPGAAGGALELQPPRHRRAPLARPATTCVRLAPAAAAAAAAASAFMTLWRPASCERHGGAPERACEREARTESPAHRPRSARSRRAMQPAPPRRRSRPARASCRATAARTDHRR